MQPNPLGVKTVLVPEKLMMMNTTRSAMMESARYSLVQKYRKDPEKIIMQTFLVSAKKTTPCFHSIYSE